MKTYKRNRKSLAVVDGAWCAALLLAMVLIIAALDWGAERVLPLIIGQAMIFSVLAKTFLSNYKKTVQLGSSAVGFDGTKDNMYAYYAPYSDIDRLIYSKSRFYGNPALIIKLKNRKKVELDTHYYDCAELWQGVCDAVKEKAPGAKIDEGIYKRIEKMKK